MRNVIRALTLTAFLACAPALAADTVTLTGRATGVFQYPKTDTICLSFETKDQKRYMICDDVTAKDIIEKLFDLGKKDADCRIEGTVAKKTGEDVYLSIARVTEGG